MNHLRPIIVKSVNMSEMKNKIITCTLKLNKRRRGQVKNMIEITMKLMNARIQELCIYLF